MTTEDIITEKGTQSEPDALWAAFETGRLYQNSQGRYDWHDCQSAGHPILHAGTDLEGKPVGLCSCEDTAGEPPTVDEVAESLQKLDVAWHQRWAS